MAAKSKVVIYTTPTCPYCNMAKHYFKDNKVEYEEKNVAADRALAEEMIHKSGQMGVPVMDIDGKIIVGFDQAEIKKALNLK